MTERPRRFIVDQPLRGRGCRGKVRWPKRKQAIGAAGMYRAAHPDDPGKVGAYRCVECRGWHIGHG